MQLLAKFKKILYMWRILFNFTKSCISSCLLKFYNKTKFHRATFIVVLLLELEIKTNKTYKSRSKLGCHENLGPLEFYFLKIYMVNSSPCSTITVCFMVTQCSQATTRKKRDIYLFWFIASKTENNSRYFDSICWRIFYRRNRRHRVAMLFKLKSVLYPPDATAIIRSRG